MAWIESHTELERHRKVILMAAELNIKPVHLSGHLHALWHNCLEQQEDGDLSKWPVTLIAHIAMFDGDADLFVDLLKKHRFIDEETMLLHDWLEYAGNYLLWKYRRRHRALLVEVWRKYGKRYGIRTGQVRDRVPQKSHTTNPVVGLVGISSSSEKDRGLGEGKTFQLPDWLPDAEWQEFKAHRKRKRAPVTDKIADRVIGVLGELRALGYDPAKVLNEAVDRNWTGLKVEWIHKAQNGSATEDTSEEALARMNRIRVGAGMKPYEPR